MNKRLKKKITDGISSIRLVSGIYYSIRFILRPSWPSFEHLWNGKPEPLETFEFKWSSTDCSAHEIALTKQKMAKWYVKYIGYPVKLYVKIKDKHYNGRMFEKDGIRCIIVSDVYINYKVYIALPNHVISRCIDIRDGFSFIFSNQHEEWEFLD